MNNPLLSFARNPELSLKLPSNNNWYDETIIDNQNPSKEFDVYPMTSKDELLQLNPDALLSGSATIELIKSCVPAIKKPEELLYPDVNVLMLAIRKATYGDELAIDVVCPRCRDEIIKINDKEEVQKLEKEHKLISYPQEFMFSISQILQTTTFLQPSYNMTLSNGLVINYKPNTLGDKLDFYNISFKHQKIQQHISLSQMNNNLSDDEKYTLLGTLTINNIELAQMKCVLLSKSIISIDLPDGTSVNDNKMIIDYLSLLNTSTIKDIQSEIATINNIGLPEELSYECPACKHEWSSKFFGFNQSDFFGKGSYF